jgi:hypothetical protein
VISIVDLVYLPKIVTINLIAQNSPPKFGVLPPPPSYVEVVLISKLGLAHNTHCNGFNLISNGFTRHQPRHVSCRAVFEHLHCAKL